MTAAYIMKCDDDTFVRVDTVLKEIEGISSKKSLYMGNLNLLHRPLRSGKWAVTYEVCNASLLVNMNDVLGCWVVKHRLYSMEPWC